MVRSNGAAWMVYMTASDRAEADRLSELLVRERLAACVNVLGAIRSTYWWDGAVQRGREIALVAKTSEMRVRVLIARVREAHSYDTPCVVAWPLEAGNPDFLAWVVRETRAAIPGGARRAGRTAAGSRAASARR